MHCGWKSKSSLTCRYLDTTELHSSNPNVICELWKSSIITEITAPCLLDASQTQISCLLELNYFEFSLGELSLWDTQKLHLPAAHKWKSLSAIGGFGCPERSPSVHAADTLDYPRPLDGICDNAILPLDYESLSALVSRQISRKFHCYICWFSSRIQLSIPTINNCVYLVKSDCAVKTR